MAEQYAASGRSQTALAGGGAGAAAVPPPPSIPGNAGSNPSGRIISLGIHPAAMSPAEMPTGNRRGTFAATPAGKTGAPGTPDIAASTNHGRGSGAGKNSDGIPSGLTVGAGPDDQDRSRGGGKRKRKWRRHGAGPRLRQLPTGRRCDAAAGLSDSASSALGGLRKIAPQM